MERIIRHLRSLVPWSRRARTPEEFEKLYRHFREIMDSNTRALEIITEMGDILGGDYLFDIQYVRRAHERLAEHLERSMDNFESLTGSRSAELHRVAARIEDAIRNTIDGGRRQAGMLVIPLSSLAEDQAVLAGAKMTNLAGIKRALPLSVPDGFVITMEAFDRYLRHNRILDTVPQPEGQDDPSWSDRMERAVMAGEIPPDLHREIEKALRRLRDRCGADCTLAVRSSAGEEDGELSFAGQYRTVLNVLPDVEAVEQAYRSVVASLFSPRAEAYRRRFGLDGTAIKMAVGVLEMVDAAASGVLYTEDPAGRSERMVINAAWGLGTSVVDGRVDADQVVAGRDGAVIESRVGSKEHMTRRNAGGGIDETDVPAVRRGERSITGEQVAELVSAGKLLEQQFRAPQDVEWAVDSGGRLFILQSRPLGGQTPEQDTSEAEEGTEERTAERISFRNSGIVVHQGVASGIVHIVRTTRELDQVPRGAILVVKHDQPDLVRVMHVIAAIITDTGSLTSHMASLAREFRVPTVVNTGDATRVLHTGQEVTVALGEAAAVYEGRSAAGRGGLPRPADMRELYEFRRKRSLLRYIAPLNLVDPFRDDFSPAACRTLHDILRFIHEKAVGSLIEAAGFGTRSPGAVKLDLPIPAGITAIDIGGGLQGAKGTGHAVPEQVLSEPFQAVIRGMLAPGAWRSDAVPLSVNDFLTSMFRAPDLIAEGQRQTGTNIAVISREYMNLNIKFGYHYTILDCYMSDTPRSNHLYFRFAGGATDMTKRSRRLRVIATVLEEQGFSIGTKGDLIIARISNVGREEMSGLLEGLGKLISYTRQLDAVLRSDEDVDRSVGNFLRGEFAMEEGRKEAKGPGDHPA